MDDTIIFGSNDAKIYALNGNTGAKKWVFETVGVFNSTPTLGKDGTVYGGPMYYMTKGLREIGYERLGKFLAIVFAFLCIGASFGGGNAAQSNQAAMQLVNSFGMTGGSARTIIGIIMTVSYTHLTLPTKA